MDAAHEGELDQAQAQHGRRQELVEVAVGNVAEADGRAADDRSEPVAARGRRRSHLDVGEEVRAGHQPGHRRVALGWRRRWRRAGRQPPWPRPPRNAG